MPTMKSLLGDLTIASFAFPGLDMEFDDTLEGMPPGENNLKIRGDYGAVNKIASLVHLPPDGQRGTPLPLREVGDPVTDYWIMNPGTLKKETLDLTYATNGLRRALAPVDAAGAYDMNFEQVRTADELSPTLKKSALSITMAASSSVLLLFSEKGPSRPYPNTLGHNYEQRGLCMNYFAQPKWNPRSSVVTNRVNKVIKTACGRTDFDLISHGVAMFPYDSQIRNQQKTLQVTGNADEVTMEKALANTEILSSYVNSVARPELYGRPIANLLESDSVLELWRWLMGCEMTSVLSVSPDVAELWEGSEDHTKAMFYLSFLIQRLQIEYNGFSSFSEWEKLNWRLRKVYGPLCAGPGPYHPVEESNVIYNTMVMFQGLSSVRLLFLEGQGRLLSATHALLGKRPDFVVNKWGEVYHPPIPSQVPSVDYAMVGAVNTKVDMISLGIETKETGLKYFKIQEMYTSLGKAIQVKAQTVDAMDVTGFMMNFCAGVEAAAKAKLGYKHPELRFKVDQRTVGWYSKDEKKRRENREIHGRVYSVCPSIHWSQSRR